MLNSSSGIELNKLRILALSFRFFFSRHKITLTKARRIRAAIVRDRQWRWWQLGFTPWFTINWMLMMFDDKKELLAERIHNGSGAIHAIGRARTILAQCNNRDLHLLGELAEEFRIREEDEFAARDRQFFMRRRGDLFPINLRGLLAEAVVLCQKDYLVLKYLCCKTARVLEGGSFLVGPLKSAMIEYLGEHRVECCQLIQDFKPTILAMALRYADNMMAFCLDHRMSDAMHQWAHAGKRVVHLQELEPTADNESFLREELDKFFKFVDEASAAMYVKYRELEAAGAPRSSDPAQTTAGKPAAEDPLTVAIRNLPILHREKPVGRFVFKWQGEALTIVDRQHRESNGSYMKFEHITGAKTLNAIEELMKAYLDGYGDFIIPLNDRNWRALFKRDNDGARFIEYETETWCKLHQTSDKAERKAHNRHRRIIPDGMALRGR